LVVVGEDADTSHLSGVDVARLPYARSGPGSPDGPGGPDGRGGRGVDVSALLAELLARGVRSVLLEGGATLAGAFVAARAVDVVTAYLAPVLLGAGPAVLADAGITTLTQALRLDVTGVQRLGPDLRVTAVPVSAAAATVAGAAAPTSAVPTAPQES
jgi:diaminohydroxyphosphoribosylaminopyrimidine deaminase/5-amino-6-(5-phosphoribosylamino)uracil reductase